MFLPPAYVVRREGNVLTRVCLSVHRGGYPYPIMLCNISQNAMGQPGGVPCQVQLGGYPAWGGVPCRGGVPCQGGYPARGDTLPRGGILLGGYPAGGVPCRGVPSWGGTLPGGTQLEQHREYLLHVGRYASCVHAEGFSCLLNYLGYPTSLHLIMGFSKQMM